MNKLPWFPFFAADWIKGTRFLSPVQKAIWIDLLCYMWESDKQGSLSVSWEGLGRQLGKPMLDVQVEIFAMAKMRIFDLFCGNCGQLFGTCLSSCPVKCHAHVTLMSRRMSRECHARESNLRRQQKFRESARLRKKRERNAKSNAFVTDKKSEVTEKEERKEEKETVTTITKKTFQKPTAQEVEVYAKQIGFDLAGEAFVDYYEAKGWVVGRSPMRSWEAAVRTWKRKHVESRTLSPSSAAPLSRKEVPHWSELPANLTNLKKP